MPNTRALLPLAAALALAACAAVPEQNAALLSTLHKATPCEASLPTFGRFPGGRDATFDTYLPPHGTIRTGNDGGWCAIRFSYAVRGQIPVIAPLDLGTPPEHGQVALGTLNGRMRIAYRPAPGYAGPDRFTVRMGGPEPWIIPVHVVVTD